MPKTPRRPSPKWVQRLRARRKALGLHGTRRWNADEIKRFGSAETFFFEIPSGKELNSLSDAQLARSLANSIARNMDYWAKAHIPSVQDFLKNPQPSEFPALVLIKNRPGNIPDRAGRGWPKHQAPFKAYSRDLASKDILDILTIEPPEMNRIIQGLDFSKPSGELRTQLLRRVKTAFQKKALHFFSTH